MHNILRGHFIVLIRLRDHDKNLGTNQYSTTGYFYTVMKCNGQLLKSDYNNRIISNSDNIEQLPL